MPADYIFRGVALGPGSHVVEFVYRPASFVWGVCISILTIGILGCIPLWARWRPLTKRSEEGEKEQLQVSNEDAVESPV